MDDDDEEEDEDEDEDDALEIFRQPDYRRQGRIITTTVNHRQRRIITKK